jgi:predicted alpha/beta-fold hydrolase
MKITSTFKAAKGLGNAHLQSMYPTIARHRLKVSTQRERLELPDGDFIDLEWQREGIGPIVILLHGMAGNLDSPYIKGMLQELKAIGWRGVMMYYRGCSGVPNRLNKTYHLGQTDDFAFTLNHLKKHYPDTPIFAIGYSMGGNILLKWLGENPEQTILNAAVTVSAPYDLRASSVAIRRGGGRIYQWLLMRDLRRYIRSKYKYPNAPINTTKIPSIKSFWDLDEKITAPVNGFKSAIDYYNKASCKRFIKHITSPTLIIHALDDPLIPKKTLPKDSELSKTVTMEISETGGHVGFISGNLQHPIFWLDGRIIAYLLKFVNSSTDINKKTKEREHG